MLRLLQQQQHHHSPPSSPSSLGSRKSSMCSINSINSSSSGSSKSHSPSHTMHKRTASQVQAYPVTFNWSFTLQVGTALFYFFFYFFFILTIFVDTFSNKFWFLDVFIADKIYSIASKKYSPIKRIYFKMLGSLLFECLKKIMFLLSLIQGS